MTGRKMSFKLDPKVANLPEFLLFMSQSHLNVEFNSENNEVLVTIPTESPAEIEKLIRNINKSFEITGFSSGNKLHFIQDSKVESSKMLIDFSYLTDEKSEAALNKLCKTIYWACKYKEITEQEIVNSFIWPLIKEISLYYSSNDEVKFQVYDIVSIMNPSSIIDDSTYTKGIVCNITDNSFFVIPLTEVHNSEPFLENEIIFFDDELQKKSYLINYESAKYVSKKRVEAVIGTINPNYYNVVLETLNETFAFMQSSSDKHTHSSNGIQETALLEIFNSAFDNLAKNSDFEQFFKSLQIENEILKNICIHCSELDKINWHTINKISNSTREETKTAFRSWLDSQQNLKEKCSTLSFTSLLKAIKKTIKQ